MLQIKDFDNEEIIRTHDSERYGNHTEFKKHINMGYVHSHTVLKGTEREEYLQKYIKLVEKTWRTNIAEHIETLIKINKELDIAKKYIDVNVVFNRLIEVNEVLIIKNLLMKL